MPSSASTASQLNSHANNKATKSKSLAVGEFLVEYEVDADSSRGGADSSVENMNNNTSNNMSFPGGGAGVGATTTTTTAGWHEEGEEENYPPQSHAVQAVGEFLISVNEKTGEPALREQAEVGDINVGAGSEPQKMAIASTVRIAADQPSSSLSAAIASSPSAAADGVEIKAGENKKKGGVVEEEGEKSSQNQSLANSTFAVPPMNSSMLAGVAPSSSEGGGDATTTAAQELPSSTMASKYKQRKSAAVSRKSFTELLQQGAEDDSTSPLHRFNTLAPTKPTTSAPSSSTKHAGGKWNQQGRHYSTGGDLLLSVNDTEEVGSNKGPTEQQQQQPGCGTVYSKKRIAEIQEFLERSYSIRLPDIGLPLASSSNAPQNRTRGHRLLLSRSDSSASSHHHHQMVILDPAELLKPFLSYTSLEPPELQHTLSMVSNQSRDEWSSRGGNSPPLTPISQARAGILCLHPPQVDIEQWVDPRTKHVVGRQSSYWSSSRRHLLMRGKPHAELGIQSSLSTRDYMASTLSILSLLNQEEEVVRQSVELQERTARNAVLLRYRAETHRHLQNVSPLIILGLMEHSRRRDILRMEKVALDRLYTQACSGLLVSWAERDCHEARSGLELALEALRGSK